MMFRSTDERELAHPLFTLATADRRRAENLWTSVCTSAE